MKKLFVPAILSLIFSVGVLAQGSTSTTTTATATTTTASGEKPKRGPVFRPTKDQIMQVQKILINKKLYTGEASGTYNDATREGIKSFQKDNGLKKTGTLNRATLEKFGVPLTDKQKEIPVSPNSYDTGSTASTATKTTTDTPKKTTIFRATKDQIMEAQKMLKAKAIYAGEETGKLDDATRDGLKKFQEANGLKVTGTLNQVTLEKMGIALTDTQKAAATATPK